MYYHYYEYPGSPLIRRHYAVRTERHKLIRFYYGIDAWKLYGMEADPREVNNVFDDPAYAALVVELKAELERLRTLYGDTEPEPGVTIPAEPDPARPAQEPTRPPSPPHASAPARAPTPGWGRPGWSG